jgi:hypothetical protein
MAAGRPVRESVAQRDVERADQCTTMLTRGESAHEDAPEH